MIHCGILQRFSSTLRESLGGIAGEPGLSAEQVRPASLLGPALTSHHRGCALQATGAARQLLGAQLNKGRHWPELGAEEGNSTLLAGAPQWLAPGLRVFGV